MAHHPANPLTDSADWFLSVPASAVNLLGTIRHWQSLRVAFADGLVWVTGFDATQINHTLVQGIPYKRVFYSRNGKLFPQGSLLPDGPVPGLLWSPIERGLPLTLPAFRGNYTAEQPPVSVRLIPAQTEQSLVAVRTTRAQLAPYLETAPAIRLRSIQWARLETDGALLIGVPLLPVLGEGFWQRGRMLLPAGLDFDLPVLTDLLATRLNPTGTDWLLWEPDATYARIPAAALVPLSVGAFRVL